MRTEKGIIYKFEEHMKNIQDKDFILCNWGSNVKHSKNIIDLIEVGDYVNGNKVTKVGKYTSDYPPFMVGEKYIEIENKEYWIHEEEKIKSIVTHQSFKQVKYEV